MMATSEEMGTPLDDRTRLSAWMGAQGFEDVVEKQFQPPTSAQARYPDLKEVGDFERENLVTEMSGMAMRL